MNASRVFSIVFFALGIFFSIRTFELSIPDLAMTGTSIENMNIPQAGGVLGFAILGAVCFACCAYLIKENK
ncbi:MAG: hypothetical protein ACYC09_15170 [Bacteroidota bacterium]